MKKYQVIAFFLVVLAATQIAALEFGADFRFGNLAFSQSRTSTDLTFPGNFLDWGLSFYAGQKISDSLRIDTGFYSDQILRNISYTTISYVEGIMCISVGPFFGYFNSGIDPILKPGISASVKLDFPSVFFIGIGADSTLNTRLTSDLDYIQEKTSVDAGFYVPNAICTLSMNQKKYTQLVSTGHEIDDTLLEFSFMSDIYQKNTPYRINIGFAYQLLSKTFIDSGVTVKQSLGSILVTTALEINITEAVFLVVGAETSVYTYGYDALLALKAPFFACNAHAGIKINIDRFIQLGQL
jgi:hypothetical protein